MSAWNQPSVSVVIPTFERDNLIGDALESVLGQGIAHVQIIVVDDGSTDNTRAVVERYGPRVEYVYQKNSGPASARNNGVSRCQGAVIAFLDSDDVWLPHKLKTEMEIFRSMPEADVIISDSEHWVEDRLAFPSRFVKTDVKTASGEPEFLPDLPPLWVRRSLVSTCCLSFRRRVLERMGLPLFDTSLGALEDWDFEIRLYHCARTVICPHVLAKVRRYPDITRIKRGTPNMPRTPEQLYPRLLGERRILQKSLGLPGLQSAVAERIEARIKDVGAEISDVEARLGK
jgi:glycosyltransferase involved in cell wall biosynthesis